MLSHIYRRVFADFLMWLRIVGGIRMNRWLAVQDTLMCAPGWYRRASCLAATAACSRLRGRGQERWPKAHGKFSVGCKKFKIEFSEVRNMG
mmetsp:Transcript_18698/g.52554  ORF Transcript_18698/g.52554 Transcript_18698/m.52554 type:complete len:91 (-) Transcript_18698:16-288(-)|eukprot:scaffold8052_cov14-Tisochrysis_lutea.AAC.1